MQDFSKAMPAVMANIEAARTSLPAVSVSSEKPAQRPALVNRDTDLEIPQRVFGAWTPEGGHRELRRPLTDVERAAVQRRKIELSDGLRAFGDLERGLVDGALSVMLGGFRSMRQMGENAESIVTVLMHVLREFPCWAIGRACDMIVSGEAALDPTWPPNDAQVYQLVAGIVSPYRKTLTLVEGLLAAPVDVPQVPRLAPPLPTRDEMLAQSALLAQRATQRVRDPEGKGDGSHMARVLAEIEARRARRSDAA